jgi:hypothetical protein
MLYIPLFILPQETWSSKVPASVARRSRVGRASVARRLGSEAFGRFDFFLKGNRAHRKTMFFHWKTNGKRPVRKLILISQFANGPRWVCERNGWNEFANGLAEFANGLARVCERPFPSLPYRWPSLRTGWLSLRTARSQTHLEHFERVQGLGQCGQFANGPFANSFCSWVCERPVRKLIFSMRFRTARSQTL